MRAWPRPTITRRGKPNSWASYKPIERSTVPCRVEITRKHAFPQCVHDSPTAQSSSPADFVVPLHTQAEAQGSVPGRHEGKRGYAIVRAGSRQPTNRRGKPILPSSCRPIERPTVPSAGEPMRNRWFPLCEHGPASRLIGEARRICNLPADPWKVAPFRPQPNEQGSNVFHCAGMIPPTDRSSRQTKSVILLQTHRESPRSVPSRNPEERKISTVQAGSRQPISRRPQPIS